VFNRPSANLECVTELAPFLCRLFNCSLHSGVFPTAYKLSYISLRLKKASLDATGLKNHRPISNLKVTSKLLEIF